MSTYETGSPADKSAGSADMNSGDMKERAVDAAAEVDAGAKYVAGVAGEEVGHVAHDAKSAARGFFDETRTQLSDQASTQQRRAAGALRSTADELEGLASGTSTGSGGAATSAVRTVGRQTQRVADWLEQREPADVVRDVRGYARRHTGAFIVIALGIGVVAGRITRALVSDARNNSNGGATGSQGDYRPGLTTGTASAGPVGTSGWDDTAIGAGAVGTGAAGTGAYSDDTPIADALSDQSDPLSPGVPSGSGQGLASADETATGEWSPSGEARR